MDVDQGTQDMGWDYLMTYDNWQATDSWVSSGQYGQSYFIEASENVPLGPENVPHGLPPQHMGRLPTPSTQLFGELQYNHQAQPQVMQGTGNTIPITRPSQLTNLTPGSRSYSATATTVSSLPTSTSSQERTKGPGQAERGRKTVSNEKRRKICQYHIDYPGTKQADIGLEFGLERSTVSKILRNIEQYLEKDGYPAARPKKGSRAKSPNLEKTLRNYVRRQQDLGFNIADDDIMQQAKLFARAANSSKDQSALMSILTSNGLQDFKQKHGIILRRGSQTNGPGNACTEAGNYVTEDGTPNKIPSPSPTRPMISLSHSLSDEHFRQITLVSDFSCHQPNSLLTTAMGGDTRHEARSTISQGTLSPVQLLNSSPCVKRAGSSIASTMSLQPNTPAGENIVIH